MSVPVSPVVAFALATGGLVGLAVARVAWRRDHPAARPLAKMSALPGVSGLCYAALVAVPEPPVARVLLAVGAAGLFASPGYFLLFTAAYTGRDEWLTRRRRLAVVGLYTGSATLAGLVPLALSPVSVRTTNGLTYPVVADRTLQILLTAGLSYPAILVGFTLLGSFLVSPRNIYRKQTGAIILGLLATVVGNAVFEAGFSPHPGLNLTAVFFAVQAIVIALALFRYEFLNVEPLAPAVVLNEIEDPVLVLDDSETLIDANSAAETLFDGEPVGRSIQAVMPGLLPAAGRSGEYVPSQQAAASTPDGVETYDLNDAPIRDQYDRERGTVVVLRDITPQKRREATLEGLQSVTREFLTAETADEVFEIAVRAADEVLSYPYSGALRYDPEADVLRPAAFTDELQQAYRDTGMSTVPPVDGPDSDAWAVFESGEPMLGERVDAGGDRSVPSDVGKSLLYPIGDHGVLGVSGRASEELEPADRRFVEILARTTEHALDRVETEQQLRENRELLATRTEQLDFFNSVLRHDLLNGMLVVRGHVEQLHEAVDGDAARHVDVIDEWTEDIATLAGEVRSVTRTLADDGEPGTEPVEPGPELERTAAKFRDSHDVTVDLPDDLDRLPAVTADDLLGSVFENILGNAIEHSDRTSPTITITADHDGETVTVRIADDGPGIPDGMKDRVFDEYVTDRESGSVGFGLYFVGLTVGRYGGSVRFEDNDPRGAVAVVELPVAETVPAGDEPLQSG